MHVKCLVLRMKKFIFILNVDAQNICISLSDLFLLLFLLLECYFCLPALHFEQWIITLTGLPLP